MCQPKKDPDSQPLDKSSQVVYSMIIPLIISIIGLILTLIALSYYKGQADAAIASQTPYVILSTEYDMFNNRRGIFLSNQGKGVAIVESIKINGENKTSITHDDWINLLNDKHLQSDCFDLAIPIHKGMPINEGSSIPIIATTVNYNNMFKQMEDINEQMENHIINIGRLDFFRETFALLRDEKIHNYNAEEKLNDLIDNEKNRMYQSIDNFEKNREELMLCSNEKIIKDLEGKIKIEITYTSLLDRKETPKPAERFNLYNNNQTSKP